MSTRFILAKRARNIFYDSKLSRSLYESESINHKCFLSALNIKYTESQVHGVSTCSVSTAGYGVEISLAYQKSMQTVRVFWLLVRDSAACWLMSNNERDLETPAGKKPEGA